MKTKHYLLTCICLFVFQYSFSQEKVLFVGNSMTYFNNMPNLFQEIANDKGRNVQAEYYAPGGTGFVNHYVDNNVFNLFENNIWDVVVLQPGTGESAGASWPVDTTIERGQKLIDSIKKYSPCAKIFLYEIPYGIKATNAIPDYNDYQAIQTKIKDSITKIANALEVPFVPAGESARMHLTSQQDLLLHNSYNDVHPNLNGSYLVACSMYAAIYQEEVTISNYLGGVSQVNATYFQDIADQIVLQNKANWLINTFNLHADFDSQINNFTVNFTNNSVNYDSLEWDFGDGTTTTDENPTHVFSSNGIKTIQLKAIKNGCEEIITKQITIGTLANESFNNKTIKIYPNPVNDVLHLSNSNVFTFKIINSLGQIVYENVRNDSEHSINLSFLNSGIYYIATNKNQKFKFIKQ
ncbi:T9SS type A sorting domain-containing protein [Flavobacterium sp.]|uniref:T9SS type A sorting domain-containing protein n=1 Tax=Flavobacterium sp. TaxID=239 RepID=UPI0040473FA3